MTPQSTHRAPARGGPDFESARGTSRRRKFLEFSKEKPVGTAIAIHGLERFPRLIGYDEKRHVLVETSLLDYSSFVQSHGANPEWVNSFEAWVADLIKKKHRDGGIMIRKKERMFGADLIFMALPTGFKSSKELSKVPTWNCWDPTLALFFFRASLNILSNSGFLVLLYSGDFDHVADVVDSARSTRVFDCVGSWSVPLDFPVYQDNRNSTVSSIYLN